MVLFTDFPTSKESPPSSFHQDEPLHPLCWYPLCQRKQCGCWIKAECKSRKGGRGRKPHSSFYSPSPFLFLYISLFLIVFSPALKFFFQPLLGFHQFLLSSEKEENQSWPESHHFCKGSAPHLPCEGRLGGFCIDPISSHLKDREERRKEGA